VQVESSGRPLATRYEAGFFKRYIQPIPLAELYIHPDYTEEEERKGRSTSWGLMQVMGQVAREYHFKGKFEELLEPAVAIEYGCMHLARLARRNFSKGGWPAVAAAYNAGSARVDPVTGLFANQVYVDKVTRQLKGLWPVKPLVEVKA
jgi:hypothetical protein